MIKTLKWTLKFLQESEGCATVEASAGAYSGCYNEYQKNTVNVKKKLYNNASKKI